MGGHGVAEGRRAARDRCADSMDEQRIGHAMSIDDAYVVEQRLGRGVDGTTELVTLDGAGPFVRKRMARETAHRVVWAALSECRCAHLPRVRATYELPREFVVVYDYVPGETVAQVMGARGRLPLAEVEPIVAQLCAAVTELHAHGIVHADIAPANVVVADDGAHLIDFGIARTVFEAPARDEKSWGTRGFAAPEQHGFAAIDTRSDIYALGRLAGYLLTGAHLSEKTYEAELRCSGLVPETVCRVLGRACAFEPSARYQTAEELAEAFAAAATLGDAPDAQEPEGGSRPVAEPEEAGQAAEPAPLSPDSSRTAAPPSASSVDAALRERPHSSTPLYRKIVVLSLTALAIIAGVAAIGLAVYQATREDAPTSPQSQSQGTGADEDDAPAHSDATPDGQDASSAQAADASLVDEAVASLEVAESSWYIDSSGYVSYAVAIKNTSSDIVAEYPTVAITGRDADGTILFADTQVLTALYPGETRYFGSIAGGGTASPDTVDITLNRPGEWEVSHATGESSRLGVSNVSTSYDEFGNLRVTGEVTLESLGDEPSAHDVQLVAIGRDARGGLAFGFSGYTSLPAEGETVPFSLDSADTDLPDYESIDVYAYAW